MKTQPGKPTEADLLAAESAEREAEAQLAVIRALKPLSYERRQNVLRALGHIMAADRFVPGVMHAIIRKP